MERPNPLIKDNLIKIFSDEEIAKAFIDAFYDHNMAKSILNIVEIQDNTDDLGVPSVSIVANSKAKYTYTVHIHSINEEHLSKKYSLFWGEIMLDGVMMAKKYDPFKPTIHIIFADHEWIDNKNFETEYQFSNPGTSRYLSGNLMQMRVIELPKLRRKLERKRNADIVKDPILGWFAFFDSEITKPLLRELINSDEMIAKAHKLMEM